MRQWTTFTPDGRQLVVRRGPDGWSVAGGNRDSALHERLEVALIDVLVSQSDFALNSMRDHVAWACEVADQIERGKHPPDADDDHPS